MGNARERSSLMFRPNEDDYCRKIELARRYVEIQLG